MSRTAVRCEGALALQCCKRSLQYEPLGSWRPFSRRRGLRVRRGALFAHAGHAGIIGGLGCRWLLRGRSGLGLFRAPGPARASGARAFGRLLSLWRLRGCEGRLG